MLYKRFTQYVEQLLPPNPVLKENLLFLVHANGVVGLSDEILDYSQNNYSITTTGTPLPSSLDPFGGVNDTHSLFLNGSTDAIKIDNLEFNPVSDDWTFECFLYATVTTNFSLLRSYNENFNITFYNGYVYMVFNGDNSAFSTPYTIPMNTWIHVAVTSQAGTAKLYINGILISSKTTTATSAKITGYIIGRSLGYGVPYGGYISNVRFNKSIIYLSNFSVPTTNPVPDANTHLLLTFDRYGAFDNSSNVQFIVYTKYGRPYLNSPGMFDTTALNFDQLSGIQYKPYNNLDLDFPDGIDYTIEFFVKSYATTTGPNYIFSIKSNGYPHKIAMWFDFTKNCLIFDNGDGTERELKGINLNTLSTFTHIAICRKNNTYRIFVNGRETLTFNGMINLTGGFTLYMGCSIGGTYGWNGLIDEFRIVKGQTVYETNFTVPQSQFPNL